MHAHHHHGHGHHHAPLAPGEKSRVATLAALASVATALFLMLLKAGAAWVTGSVAMLGSLADTSLDLLASAVLLYGVRLAATPADDDHRFGHGKAEALAALFQVALISVSAGAIGWRAAVRLTEDTPTTDPALGIGVSLVAMLATVALLAFQRSVIRRTGSVAIRADHVHYQSDLLLNGAVILALALETWGGVTGADPVLGILIALWLAYGAFGASKFAIDQLMDREWPEAERQRFVDVASRHPQLLGIHDFRTRRAGSREFAQFHLVVDGGMSVMAAHDVVEDVETSLAKAFPGVEVLIHLDPEGHVDEPDNPLQEADVTPAWFGKRA